VHRGRGSADARARWRDRATLRSLAAEFAVFLTAETVVLVLASGLTFSGHMLP
jgi:hypothetical protein